jgi:hypothetical protein
MVADEGIDMYFGERALGPQLKVIPKRDSPDADYLKYHQRHVFQGWPAGP